MDRGNGSGVCRQRGQWKGGCESAPLFGQAIRVRCADRGDGVTTYLSSTPWNKQFGVCVVVKILFSGGILGAKRTTFCTNANSKQHILNVQHHTNRKYCVGPEG
jgi:hypothetical protein